MTTRRITRTDAAVASVSSAISLTIAGAFWLAVHHPAASDTPAQARPQPEVTVTVPAAIRHDVRPAAGTPAGQIIVDRDQSQATTPHPAPKPAVGRPQPSATLTTRPAPTTSASATPPAVAVPAPEPSSCITLIGISACLPLQIGG